MLPIPTASSDCRIVTAEFSISSVFAIAGAGSGERDSSAIAALRGGRIESAKFP
jgi:hypothetical protein